MVDSRLIFNSIPLMNNGCNLREDWILFEAAAASPPRLTEFFSQRVWLRDGRMTKDVKQIFPYFQRVSNLWNHS
jgi:hypothetical protein